MFRQKQGGSCLDKESFPLKWNYLWRHSKAGGAFVDMCPLQTPQKTLMAVLKDEETPRPEQLV